MVSRDEMPVYGVQGGNHAIEIFADRKMVIARYEDGAWVTVGILELKDNGILSVLREALQDIAESE